MPSIWTSVVLVAIITSTVTGNSPFKKHIATSAKSSITASSTAGQWSPSLLQRPAAGNPFDIVYEWNVLDFAYPSEYEHRQALLSGDFVPENNLPLGVDRWQDRLFVTMPRWKNGVPASLAWLPLPAVESSPAMQPYPSWAAHGDPLAPDCSKLMSVYRLWIDECERLWVVDAGVVNATIQINQVCPPKIVAFDLRNDRQLFSFEIPADQIKEDSLHSNIVVDIRDGQCHDAYAYVTDVWRFGVVVFSLSKGRSWRTTNHLYMPNPLASDYTLHGLNFQWTDGVFGLSLAPVNEYRDRLMFYHPMSSYGEFMVSTSVIRNESLWTNGGTGMSTAFRLIGERGVGGQSSTSGIDRSGVMFYNLISQDAVGCWDTAKPYNNANLGIVGRDNVTLIFPNDMKLDREEEQVRIARM